MSFSSERALRIGLTVLLLAAAAFVVRNAYFLRLAKTEYAFFATLLSVTVLHLRLRHQAREFVMLVICVLALSFIATRAEQFPPPLPECMTLIGLASFILLGRWVIWCKATERAVPAWAFAGSATLIGSGWVLPWLLAWGGRVNPKVFDLYLYSFDASLRFQPSFLMGTAFLRWPAFRTFSMVFYTGITSVCTLVFAELLTRDMRKALASLFAFLLSGPIGILFYNLCPAAGPLYLFGSGFPLHPLPIHDVPRLQLEPVPLFGFRNAIPSLHMTWALLGLWYARGASWWVRGVALAFLGFTVIATLGTGEHYLIDLVVAFPFSLMLFAVFLSLADWKDPKRARAMAFGLVATLLWIALLRFQPRFFWISPVIPWVLIVLTLVSTMVLQRRLVVPFGLSRKGPLPGQESLAEEATVG